MISGRATVVEQAAENGLRLARATGDLTRARCLAAIVCRRYFVDSDQCQTMAREAHDVAVTAGDPFSRDWATVVEAYTLTTRTRHHEATKLARLAFERSWPRGDRFYAAFARAIELWVAVDTGTCAVPPRSVTSYADRHTTGRLLRRLHHGRQCRPGPGDDGQHHRGLDHATGHRPLPGRGAGRRRRRVRVHDGMLHLWNGDLDDVVRWLARGIGRMTDNSKDWTATYAPTS